MYRLFLASLGYAKDIDLERSLPAIRHAPSACPHTLSRRASLGLCVRPRSLMWPAQPMAAPASAPAGRPYRAGRGSGRRSPPSARAGAAIIHRFELAAVDGHAGFGAQANLATQIDKARAHLTDGLSIVFPEVGDHLVIGNKAAEQPHHFEIAAGLSRRRRYAPLGHVIEVRDLYAEGFNPALDAEERGRYYDEGDHRPDIASQVASLLRIILASVAWRSIRPLRAEQPRGRRRRTRPTRETPWWRRESGIRARRLGERRSLRYHCRFRLHTLPT